MTQTPSGAEQINLLTQRMKRRDPILAQLMTYWESLRVAGDIPRRGDIEPQALQDILSHAFVLDRLRPGTIRMRVAGQVLSDLMGMDVRGMPIRAFFDLSERRSLMERVEACFAKPALLELDLSVPLGGGREMDASMLILPLRDHESNVTKAIGCLALDGIVGFPPHRFKIRRQQLTPVSLMETETVAGQAEVRLFSKDSITATRKENAAPASLRDTHVPFLKIVERP